MDIELHPIHDNLISSSGSNEQSHYLKTKMKKIKLPSYSDERTDRPVHVVRDSDASHSSKTNTLSGTKRLTDTLQQRSDDLQAIPSDREEEQSAEELLQDPSQALDSNNR